MVWRGEDQNSDRIGKIEIGIHRLVLIRGEMVLLILS